MVNAILTMMLNRRVGCRQR